MLKVTKHTVRCDPVKGFNHPVRSGLVGGLKSIPLECHLDQRVYKRIVGSTLIKGFWTNTMLECNRRFDL